MTEERFRGILEEVLEEKLEVKLEEKLDAKLEVKLEKINTRLDSLEDRMDHAESEIHRIGIILENDVVRPIRLLCENLYPTSKGWIENEHRLSTLEEDVAVIKTVVKKHSESIQILQQA